MLRIMILHVTVKNNFRKKFTNIFGIFLVVVFVYLLVRNVPLRVYKELRCACEAKNAPAGHQITATSKQGKSD